MSLSRYLPGIKKLTFAALAVILCFCVLEFLARYFEFAKDNPRNWYFLDSELGFTMTPDSQDFTQNNQETRYLMIGDSLLYIPLLQGNSSTLKLRKKGYPISELSAKNYGNTQQWLYFRQFQQTFPDLKKVFLHFCLFNDFMDNAPSDDLKGEIPPRPYLVMDSAKQIQLQNAHIQYRALDKLHHFIQMHWITYHMLKTLFIRAEWIPDPDLPWKIKTQKKAIHFDSPPPSLHDIKWHQSQIEEGKPITREILLLFQNEMIENQRVNLILILHPHGFVSDESNPLELTASLRSYFKAFPMLVYDMGCHYGQDNLLFEDIAIDRVGHLTPKGIEILTIFLENEINGKKGYKKCYLNSES